MFLVTKKHQEGLMENTEEVKLYQLKSFGILLVEKRCVREVWRLLGKMTDQGQKRYEPLTFTDAAHNLLSSIGNTSREMNNGTSVHAHASASEGRSPAGVSVHQSCLEIIYSWIGALTSTWQKVHLLSCSILSTIMTDSKESLKSVKFLIPNTTI